MKTAISLPDPLFHEAEQFAHAKGLSHGELYAHALQFFLASRQAEEITARLNEVYADEASQLDPTLAVAQALTMRRNNDDDYDSSE